MSIREYTLKKSDDELIGEAIRMPIIPRGEPGEPIELATEEKGVGDTTKVVVRGSYTPPSGDKPGAWNLGGNFAVSDSGDLNVSKNAAIKWRNDHEQTVSVTLTQALEKIGQLENAVSELKSKPIKSALPVGSVLFSSQSQEQFQSNYDGSWVRCLGQTVEGFGKVPDLRERFPRIVSDEANLGKTQEQSTNKGDLGVSIDSLVGGKISVNETLKGTAYQAKANIRMFCDTRPPARGEGGDWHFYGGANSAIKTRVKKPDSNEYYDGEHNLIGADPNEGVPMGHGGQQIFKDVGHHHEVQVGLEKTFTVSGASVSASVNGGEGETRPKACYINAFIRVS